MAIQRTKTDLEQELVYGIDPKTRRISFGVPMANTPEEEMHMGDFSQLSVELAVRAIRRMEHEHPKKPIEIHMMSYGGDAEAMLYLHDVIEASTCQFKFFGGGVIMSSATWIMAVCDERYLYRNTNVMVHDGSPDSNDGKTTEDAAILAAEQIRRDRILHDIYAHNSIMPYSFWKQVCKRDLYMPAHEVVGLGLADKVIEPKKRGNLRKIRSEHMKKITENPKILKTLVNKLYKRINLDISVKELVIKPAPIEKNDPNIVIDDTPVPPSPEGEMDN